MGYHLISPDQRNQIIEQAKTDIISGQRTLDQIASDHGITSRTLRYWLSSLGDEYKQLRDAWVDNLLADAIDAQDNASKAIDDADEMFPLARAREQLRAAESKFKSAAWIAERRDRARYGQQPTSTGSGPVTVQIVIGSVADAAHNDNGTRIIEHDTE